MKQITAKLVQQVIQPRPTVSHKGTFGRVMVVGGNQQFGGAAIMSATAAVYGGAGLVTCATDLFNATSLHAQLPEAMVLAATDAVQMAALLPKMDVIVVGPGLGTDTWGQTVLQLVFQHVQPQQVLIIDGSAIDLIASQTLTLPKAQLVFTPHQMEWQRLSGIAIADQQVADNLAVQQQLQATVVLKSARTQVYLPNGIVWENTVGTPAMATGGMGDTLTGVLAAFAAQFKPLDQAILAGVYTHSAIASQLAQRQYVVLPTQIARQLPFFMQEQAQQG